MTNLRITTADIHFAVEKLRERGPLLCDFIDAGHDGSPDVPCPNPVSHYANVEGLLCLVCESCAALLKGEPTINANVERLERRR